MVGTMAGYYLVVEIGYAAGALRTRCGEMARSRELGSPPDLVNILIRTRLLGVLGTLGFEPAV